MVGLGWRRAAALLLLAVAGCGGSPSAVLVDPGIDQVSGSSVRVGEVFCFGFWDLQAEGSGQIRVTGVELIGKPPALKVVEVHSRATRPHGIIGAELSQYLNRKRLEPLRELTVTPGQEPHRQLLMCVRADKLGTYQTQGLRVRYTVDGQPGQQEYNHRLQLTVTRPAV